MEKVHQVRAESVIWNPTRQLTTNSQDKCLHVNISEPVFGYKNLQLKADKICIIRLSAGLPSVIDGFMSSQLEARIGSRFLLASSRRADFCFGVQGDCSKKRHGDKNIVSRKNLAPPSELFISFDSMLLEGSDRLHLRAAHPSGTLGIYRADIREIPSLMSYARKLVQLSPS
jgi:hypothetical protein